MQITDIIARLRAETASRIRYALEHGETPYSLAKKAELHRNTLYGWDDENWKPTAETLVKLEPHLPKLPKSRSGIAA